MQNHNSAAERLRLSHIKNLRQALALVSQSLIDVGYGDQVRSTEHLIDHNEYGIALECLCENLYDEKRPIPRKAYNLLVTVGSSIGTDKKYWEHLEPQIIES